MFMKDLKRSSGLKAVKIAVKLKIYLIMRWVSNMWSNENTLQLANVGLTSPNGTSHKLDFFQNILSLKSFESKFALKNAWSKKVDPWSSR